MGSNGFMMCFYIQTDFKKIESKTLKYINEAKFYISENQNSI